MKEYYSAHSNYSDPKNYGYLYCHFSADISETTKQIQNLFLHYADVNLFLATIDRICYSDLNLRYAHAIIQKIVSLDSRPLNLARTVDNRVMGVCRDTSLLLCSFLRSHHIPARLRSGFVNYFIPGLFLDGYAVEYFNETLNRWCLVDTRTMQAHIDHYQLKIDFDLMDVPQSKFISAADAWRMCRFENADPSRFGSRQHRGLFTIRNRLIQDLSLLNKRESLIWDIWGPMLMSFVTDFDLLDQLSELLLNDSNNIEKITSFYEKNTQLQMPNLILVDNPFLSAEWVTVC